MNKIYKIIVMSFCGIMVISQTSFAQNTTTAKQDSLLNREVLLKREYTPFLQDATKVNTHPAKPDTKQQPPSIHFENTMPDLSLSTYPIADTGSGEIRSQLINQKQRGYLNFGAGMYSNLEGSVGIRILDNYRYKLDLFATHSSTNGKVKYEEATSTTDKVKAKNMENFVKIRYERPYDYVNWYVSGSFLNNSFNYYGNPYLTGIETFPQNINKKQTINIFEGRTGIISDPEKAVIYKGNIIYNHLSNKYASDISFDGFSANIIDINADVAVPIFCYLPTARIGVKSGIFFQKIDQPDFITSSSKDSVYHNLTLFKANPYISIGNKDDDLEILLGVNINLASDYKNKTVISPTIKLSKTFQERTKLYLSVNGGINDNNLVFIHNENKYMNPNYRVHISRTLYNSLVGIKSGVIEGLDFDIFGGYKYTKNDHLYLQSSATSWSNVSKAVYADLGTGHLGVSINTLLIPQAYLSIKATSYFYNLKKYTQDMPIDTKKAWGLPSFTMDFNVDFSILDNLDLTVHYLFGGGRKTLSTKDYTPVNMKSLNELNVKADYQILNWLSVYAKANNVLSQKYENFYGYTTQGINILGGVSVKF